MYTAIKYNTREDVVAAFKKMMQRKREWVDKTERSSRNYAKWRNEKTRLKPS